MHIDSETVYSRFSQLPCARMLDFMLVRRRYDIATNAVSLL